MPSKPGLVVRLVCSRLRQEMSYLVLLHRGGNLAVRVMALMPIPLLFMAFSATGLLVDTWEAAQTYPSLPEGFGHMYTWMLWGGAVIVLLFFATIFASLRAAKILLRHHSPALHQAWDAEWGVAATRVGRTICIGAGLGPSHARSRASPPPHPARPFWVAKALPAR